MLCTSYQAVRVQASFGQHPAGSERSPSPATSAPVTISSHQPQQHHSLQRPIPEPSHEEPEFDLLEDLEHIQHDFGPNWLGSRAIAELRMAEDFSEGRLETLVGKPQKELPGTKDAYVSYLVTTKVSICSSSSAMYSKKPQPNSERAVRLPILPAPRVHRTPSLHRLRLPLETAQQRISTMRSPTPARQAQDGVRAR